MAESEPDLATAIESLGRGEFQIALQQCQRVLAVESDNAKAWHLCGIIHAQQNELARAAECFEQAVELRGDVATYHYNLGLACQSLHDDSGAITAYQAAVAIKPDFIEAQNNLGNCLLQQGEIIAAVNHFRNLVQQFADESIVRYNLANVLQDAGEYQESIDEFRRVIELDPDFVNARENLGRALSDVTRYDEALQVWKAWLEHDPESAVARHMIASVTGQSMPTRCDDEYVRETFDENFAKSYEKQLQRILYQVPELVGQSIAAIDFQRHDMTVLDAGCGTGLCAQILRPLAAKLIGVDLSSDMLQEASKRNIYDQLHEHELTAFLQSQSERYDLIVCGDTLCYFGDLGDVLAGFKRCLATAGKVVFTVERWDDEETSNEDAHAALMPYQLQPNGRYRHLESYVRETLHYAGLTALSIASGTLRMERGREVVGLIVTAA